MKKTIKIILAIVIMLGAIALYEKHEDRQRELYAAANNCTWTVYGAHDICK